MWFALFILHMWPDQVFFLGPSLSPVPRLSGLLINNNNTIGCAHGGRPQRFDSNGSIDWKRHRGCSQTTVLVVVDDRYAQPRDSIDTIRFVCLFVCLLVWVSTTVTNKQSQFIADKT